MSALKQEQNRDFVDKLIIRNRRWATTVCRGKKRWKSLTKRELSIRTTLPPLIPLSNTTKKLKSSKINKKLGFSQLSSNWTNTCLGFTDISKKVQLRLPLRKKESGKLKFSSFWKIILCKLLRKNNWTVGFLKECSLKDKK